MVQLIDKAAVVEEIEIRIKEADYEEENNNAFHVFAAADCFESGSTSASFAD